MSDNAFRNLEEQASSLSNEQKLLLMEKMMKSLKDNSAQDKQPESDQPEHKMPFEMVPIPDRCFEMMSTEVTQKLYQEIMGTNPSEFKEPDHPVENVSWYDAIKFCNALSFKYELTPVYTFYGENNMDWNRSANGFRLPTLDEWTYAARGGYNYTYSGSNRLDVVGWCQDNSGGKTHPVGMKKANGYGLYDMSGNVWEWCWDPYIKERSFCGGSWRFSAYDFDVNSERTASPDNRRNDIGFRIVRDIVIESEEADKKMPFEMAPIPGYDFDMMITTVTQKLYQDIMRINPSEIKGDDLPVINVSRNDAVNFCNALSEKYGFTPAYTINGEDVELNKDANGFRLPTVEEWQYAANGGQNYQYAGGEDMDAVGWFARNSNCELHPVGQKISNGYGLYDMSGNVWEWCWASKEGDRHSYSCGGAWNSYNNFCLIEEVRRNNPYDIGNDFGFRIVRKRDKVVYKKINSTWSNKETIVREEPLYEETEETQNTGGGSFKKFITVVFFLALSVFGVLYFISYQKCAEAFRYGGCMHGINVDGQWFSNAYSMAFHTMFKFGDVEYYYHSSGW